MSAESSLAVRPCHDACKPSKAKRPVNQAVCLFAHFDPLGRIGIHVLHYVSALAGMGYRVIFASSGQPPSAEDIASVKQAGAAGVVCRENGGIDWGAWRDLLRAGYADGADAVLLANDSVFGPLWDLGTATRPLTSLRDNSVDVWGMVESLQGTWHLQSWFLHMTAAVLSAAAVRRVFDQPFERMGKEEIIVRGELGLGAALRTEGARCGAVYNRSHASALGRIAPSNPMHLNWRGMITKRIVPFLKADLLRCNTSAIPWMTDWPNVVSRHSNFPVEWIHSYLYAYTGIHRPSPSASFLTPVTPLGLRGRILYAALSIDHGAAVRSMLGYLRQ